MLLNLLQEFDLCHLLMLENYFAIFSDPRHPVRDVKTLQVAGKNVKGRRLSNWGCHRVSSKA